MFLNIVASLFVFLALIPASLLAQSPFPTQWHVNGNGYIGILTYTVDPTTLNVRGTLLGTPCEGVMVGRRLILHRTPRGSQIWEGWIMDAQLGAPGQPYYNGQYFIAGTISEGQANNSLYPWYGVPMSSGAPPWVGGAGGQTGFGGGGQLGVTGGGQIGFGGGGQPGVTGGGQTGFGGGQTGFTSGGGQTGFGGGGQTGVTGGGQTGFGGGGQPGVTGGGQSGFTTSGGGSSPTSGNLVVNGSFELGPAVGSLRTLKAGATDLPGWAITKGTIDINGTYLVSGHGERSADLVGTPGSGGLQQIINTVPGQVYELSFLLAGNCGGGPQTKTLVVTVGDVTRTFTFSIAGKNNQQPGWVRQSLTFRASGSRTSLSFADPGDPRSGERCGATIDDVVVVPASGGSQSGGIGVRQPGIGEGSGVSAVGGDPLPGMLLESIRNLPERYNDRAQGNLDFTADIDGEVLLHIRGDQIYCETLNGRPVSVKGFAFSQPLPAGKLSSLELKKKDGRGKVELRRRPTPGNGYSASIYVSDPKGGDDTYRVQLQWKR